MSTGEHMSLCAKHDRLFGKCCECLRDRCDELEADLARTWGLHTEEEERRFKAEHERDKLGAIMEKYAKKFESITSGDSSGHADIGRAMRRELEGVGCR